MPPKSRPAARSIPYSLVSAAESVEAADVECIGCHSTLLRNTIAEKIKFIAKDAATDAPQTLRQNHTFYTHLELSNMRLLPAGFQGGMNAGCLLSKTKFFTAWLCWLFSSESKPWRARPDFGSAQGRGVWTS